MSCILGMLFVSGPVHQGLPLGNFTPSQMLSLLTLTLLLYPQGQTEKVNIPPILPQSPEVFKCKRKDDFMS